VNLRWNLVALALTIIPIGLAVLPIGSQTETSSSGASGGPDGTVSSIDTTTVSHPSLLTAEGPSVLLVLAVPVAITTVPLLWRQRRGQVGIGAAVALGLFVILGILTIGLFYLPALVALVVSTAAGFKSSPSRTPA
jgi:hypothetical protein